MNINAIGSRSMTTVVLLVGVLLTVSCSDPSEPTKVTPQISVFPDLGTPGTPVEIRGMDASRFDMEKVVITIGGQPAPAIRDIQGRLVSGIPLFMDAEGAESPPASPVDLIVMVDGTKYVEAISAITVLALPDEPGAGLAMIEALDGISGSLGTIVGSFASEPGIQEQYLAASIGTLEALLQGDTEFSMSRNLTLLQDTPGVANAFDGMLAATGILRSTQEFSARLQALVAELPPVNPVNSKSVSALELNDETLALMMQFYVIANDFGQQVVSETGREYSESLGLFLGVVGIGTTVPYAAATSVILAYIDYVVNKVILGLLPAHLDAVNLSLATQQLEPGENTQATITLLASNERPTLSLQQAIGNVLTFIGASGSPTAIQSFREVLENTAAFFLTTMQSIIGAYASTHPDLNLDVEIFRTVPRFTWSAVANNPLFLDCKTFSSDIILPLPDELDWVAQDQHGLGRIYVMPSLSADSRLLSGYYGGAFGLETTASATMSVRVGGDLVVEVTAPSGLAPGESADITVLAGYEIEGGGINWAPDIAVSFDIEGGSLANGYGITDDNGLVTNNVAADDPAADTIEIIIEAVGEANAYGAEVVKIGVGKGLKAYYSNGAVVMEGPILHGWNNDCPENHMYQGYCTMGSPVNWARDGWEPDTGFYVSWVGSVFAPVSGSYRFGSWVDGKVFVEIAGVIVGDVDTPGGGYSGYVNLEGGSWVPVFMYFETNGGSNNMGLRWNLPGVAQQEVVPRKYLTH